jgi:hypothetical protein
LFLGLVRILAAGIAQCFVGASAPRHTTDHAASGTLARTKQGIPAFPFARWVERDGHFHWGVSRRQAVCIRQIVGTASLSERGSSNARASGHHERA